METEVPYRPGAWDQPTFAPDAPTRKPSGPYVHDDRSRAFCAWRARLGGSLPLTLHAKAELVNSIALAVFRGDLSTEASEGAMADMESDLAAGRLHLADLLWRKALERAADLSREHTPKLGTRTLDVLHVATALVLRCRTFRDL
jgi:hypothetical protein